MIPPGTVAFLQKLEIKDEIDTKYWTQIEPYEYMIKLGTKKYGKAQKILPEIRDNNYILLKQILQLQKTNHHPIVTVAMTHNMHSLSTVQPQYRPSASSYCKATITRYAQI